MVTMKYPHISVIDVVDAPDLGEEDLLASQVDGEVRGFHDRMVLAVSAGITRSRCIARTAEGRYSLLVGLRVRLPQRQCALG